MKYAFIDYENLHSLDGLNLVEYERIFLFVGATNKCINLTEKFSDEINITLITVKDIGKNNVDFHIAYYLGKLDTIVDKRIEFYILSNDQGYNGICQFISQQNNKRVCLRIENNKPEEQKAEIVSEPQEIDKVTQALNEYVAYIKQTTKRHLPAKLSTLQNDIHNRTCLKAFNKQDELNTIANIIQELVHHQFIKIVDSKVNYL